MEFTYTWMTEIHYITVHEITKQLIKIFDTQCILNFQLLVQLNIINSSWIALSLRIFFLIFKKNTPHLEYDRSVYLFSHIFLHHCPQAILAIHHHHHPFQAIWFVLIVHYPNANNVHHFDTMRRLQPIIHPWKKVKGQLKDKFSIAYQTFAYQFAVYPLKDFNR